MNQQPFSRAKKVIEPDMLVAMNDYSPASLHVDLVYSRTDHPENIFKTALYRPDAKLWLHQDLAQIVLAAARRCYKDFGYVFVLRDGLRPVEVQAAMQETDIVKKNPQWCRGENRLLSKPGQGGHPRGMAVDITLETTDGDVVPMGTGFDAFEAKPDGMPVAHRGNKDLPADILQNRKILEICMMEAADDYGQTLLPLPQEWWDFRFPAAIVNDYAPLYDRDLPPAIKMAPMSS